jgi:hypothetical protein
MTNPRSLKQVLYAKENQGNNSNFLRIPANRNGSYYYDQLLVYAQKIGVTFIVISNGTKNPGRI